MFDDDAEQQVESMIAEGRRVMAEAIEQYKPVAIVAAYSSGDDSIVSTHFAMTNYPDAFVFNADTMVGLAPSRCHLKAVCEKFGWGLEVEQALPQGPPETMHKGGRLVPFDEGALPAGRWLEGGTRYEEAVLNFGFPGKGKRQHRIMYSKLKERPLRRLLARYAASPVQGRPKVLIVAGIRSDESSNRAGYRETTRLGYYGDVWVNPFYYSTAADFEAYRQEFGLPRNPAKRLCGISGECCCGTFGSQDERAGYRVVDPSFADYLDSLEARVKANGFPWGWGESPPQWWVNERADKKAGQMRMFDDEPASEFQPMCVGCNNGRR